MTTTADERLEKVREHVSGAVKCLVDVLYNEVWGHDHYKQEYLDELHTILGELNHVKKRL